ncbi:PIF1-like helicase [Medicago truncatula]|uniref:PIF1-like helicase n=1 Tax=Medicago truncatula TaxID=3880 RepID=G7JAZ2_MEDTR|nr:PIF1-like helicase [Medicago truncatula]
MDSPLSTNPNGDAIIVVHTPEFLNTINTPGLPNHKLRLKVGVPVMLLRNIDQRSGLCNDTRLIITRMDKFVLEGKVIFEAIYLYVSISRVTSRDGLKILTTDENVQDANVTSNVLYPKVFRNDPCGAHIDGLVEEKRGRMGK